MASRTMTETGNAAAITTGSWLKIGLQAGLAAILVVLLTQAAILALWPELASFKPLESYPRSALFTFIPAMAASAIFARLVKTQERPVRKFLWISAGFLLLSFIPDYLLPVPHRTFQASSAAATLHLVAGIVTVWQILAGYARSDKTSNRD